MIRRQRSAIPPPAYDTKRTPAAGASSSSRPPPIIVFADFEGDEFNEFITRLTSVRRRLEKTRLRLSHELRCRGCRNAGRAQSRCNVGSFCSRSGPAGPGNGDAARALPDQVVNLPPQTIQSHLEFDIRILRLVHPQCH